MKKLQNIQERNSARLTAFFLLIVTGFLAFFIVSQGPKSDDTRKYSHIEHAAFTSYPGAEIINVSVAVNESAQDKLPVVLIDSLVAMSNRDCNKLLKTHSEITSVIYEDVFISVYEGSPYVHLDIKLQTFENSSEPKPKKFHQTFNVIHSGSPLAYTPELKHMYDYLKDSIAIIETKFLY